HVPDADAAMVRRLKRAGAVLLGFTNMHEFAWGGTTANPHYGATRNAWDIERIPAGSSGGSGAAVAAGSALAALGTDTGGSIRLPASMNGVTGLRPTVGRLSVEGIFPLAASMDTVGPIARGSADCAVMFDGMLGPTREFDAADQLLARLERPLHGLSIGIVDGYGEEGVQPDIAEAFRETIRMFERSGAVIRPLKFDGLEYAVDAQVIVDAAEPSAVHDAWIDARAEEYGSDVLAQLRAGRVFSATEYLHAQRYRTFLRMQFDAVFDSVDVILTPTLPFTAPKMGQEWVMIGEREESTLTGNMRFTSLPSLTALPALSFPIGFDRDELPIGGQLIGASMDEWSLLRVAHRFQAETDFHTRMPIL
ncbi:MAG: amidase, partial [Rhizobiaceae bacterium]|nr:amidase [Rhizobiaceae bacterium]